MVTPSTKQVVRIHTFSIHFTLHFWLVGNRASTVQLFQTNDEVCSKPKGKATHEIERNDLKPCSRNDTVRDSRALGGKVSVALFQPASVMPRVVMKFGNMSQTAPSFYSTYFHIEQVMHRILIKLMQMQLIPRTELLSKDPHLLVGT